MSLILCKKKSLQMRAKSRTKASLSLLKQGMKKSQIYLKEIGTYLPLVTLENEQQKSCWSKVQCSAFENPEHKDPQRILFLALCQFLPALLCEFTNATRVGRLHCGWRKDIPRAHQLSIGTEVVFYPNLAISNTTTLHQQQQL